ncbi:glycosyltransferase [Bacteroidota bacterium]
MLLSVVVVNYNVRYFLEQALFSIRKACLGLEAEIIVVDNHSADGSCEMVRHRFPEVILIENKENTGFSKANNQGIRIAKGRYILLINPDTVVEEDCFKKVVTFMESTPDAGAVGVKMIDGAGKFLPESKRGLPTPEVAFYKIFGLAALFPKSKRFGKYHLGFLSKDEVHEVDVLAGAFMMIRREAFDKAGLLDEDYFMYGEDIDLSYRITRSGFKNYYFPGTTIIHYKGESTKRTSVNYVFTFYRAMIIFARKHYSQSHARTFSLLIHFAIYIRAFAAVGIRFLSKTLLPFLDLFAFIGLFLLIKNAWSEYRFETPEAYPQQAVLINSVVYALLWMGGLMLAGAYLKRRTFLSITKGIAFGTLAIAVFYAFVDEGYRFSRALIVLGGIATVGMAYFNRLLLYLLKYRKFSLRLGSELRTIIVGNPDEVARVQDLLVKSKSLSEYLGYVGVDTSYAEDNHYLGHVSQLAEIAELFKVEEIIFCAKDLSAGRIIEWMGIIGRPEVMFKIVPEESLFIIGSHSKNSPGDFYTLEFNLALAKPFEQQKKRLFDLSFSLLLVLFLPVLIVLVRNRIGFLNNWLAVISGNKTWVGYAITSGNQVLPGLKSGVLSPLDRNAAARNVNEVTAKKLNFLYAKDYSVEKDFVILIKSLRNLGNQK